MSESCKQLSDFGKQRVRELGEQRHEHYDKPSTPRYLAALLLRLTGEIAGFTVLLAFIISPFIVMFQVASTGSFSFAGWQNSLLHLAGWFGYSYIAKWLADRLGYESWWGLPL